MVEPFGFLFLLAGLYVFPNRSLLAGFLWALAAMARAESWLFSGGLLVAALLSRQSSDRKMGLVIGWAVPMVFYMKYLLDWTGNAIYPLYWNFLANAAGEWVYRETYTSYQLAARPILVGVFTLALLAALWTLWKRPRAYLLYLLGFGTTAFITGFIGLTPYLTGYETWFWLTRFFAFPYMFLSVLIVVFLIDWLPKKIRFISKSHIGWMGVVAVGFVIQFTWPAVLYDLEPGYTNQPGANDLEERASIVDNVHDGGRVLIPEDNPQLTYALVRFGNFNARDFLGQMYGPIYYYEGEDPYSDWDTVGPDMWNWLREEDVTVLLTYHGDRRFQTMIEEKPERIVYIERLPNTPVDVYKVNPW